MFEQIYHHANALWPLWGICLFAGIIAWAFWPSNKARFEKDAQIPFDDDEPSPKMELR
ncbi:MAG: cbb3-type cytochrome oxidase subunit 3 [Geminicoccaceae bacterium]